MISFLLIALSTLISEDLTCIATGVLIAQAKVGLWEGIFACLAGIFAGDLLLFLAGRLVGRPRFISEERVAQASLWLRRRGMIVVLLSRFTPGLRLPTYVAAGMLRTRFIHFAMYLLMAASIWTPLLVLLTVAFGEQILKTALARIGGGVLAITIAVAVGFSVSKLLRFAFSFRVRRAIAGFFLRKVRWEFWPPWVAYIPLVPWLAWLAIKHRSLTLFTAANPGMPSGGFAGESKSEILSYLSRVEGAVAAFTLLPRIVRSSIQTTFPVVLKPDVGERGSGVSIVLSQSEMDRYLRSSDGDVIVQEYVPGLEFGVFYYRYPGESKGRILSITEKRFPEITGDGRSTVAELIVGDSRAVCMASAYMRASRRPIDDVPAAGESVRLVEIGSHCRGAVFLDGTRLKTQALEDAIDTISQAHPGFFFGRYDVRTPSVEDFQAGRFKVIELNGVSAEATHIYDPAVRLFDAYRSLFAQWRIAFEIGAINRQLGVMPMTLIAIVTLIWNHLCKNTRSSGSNTWPLAWRSQPQ